MQRVDGFRVLSIIKHVRRIHDERRLSCFAPPPTFRLNAYTTRRFCRMGRNIGRRKECQNSSRGSERFRTVKSPRSRKEEFLFLNIANGETSGREFDSDVSFFTRNSIFMTFRPILRKNKRLQKNKIFSRLLFNDAGEKYRTKNRADTSFVGTSVCPKAHKDTPRGDVVLRHGKYFRAILQEVSVYRFFPNSLF